MRTVLLAILALLLVAGCADRDPDVQPPQEQIPAPPTVPTGPLDDDVEAELQALLTDLTFLSQGDVDVIEAGGDLRVGWVIVDLLRFHQVGSMAERLEALLAELAGVDPGGVAWVAYSDLLLRWDIPAPPGYLDMKRSIHLAYDPSWEPFFDAAADLDWREVAWGGVGRDGIESLVDPVAIPADDATWLRANDVVFGLEIGGEARAYPRRILEVHEMANDTLGGVRLALSYCTLCGAPIPYATEDVAGVDEPLELRTSGLLQRANKLMYDVQTESLFDQFRGVGLSGPLRDVELERLPLVVTTWDEWRNEHRSTTVLDIPGQRGRDRELERYTGNLFERRDADGPIFPVGERDERLPEMTRVLGVQTPRGVAVAFPIDDARAALEARQAVEAGGVGLSLDGGGLTARVEAGGPVLPAHEAFWFAWSQFRPDTLLWTPQG